ncbi:MAG: Z1 domain-containing protein [bacterium]|nr:Z1 domain-containing protein [Candidatus Limimorpha caballi]
MNELYDNAINICRLMIKSSSVTDETIKSVIRSVLYMPEFKELDANKLFEELSVLYNTHIGNYQILSGRDRQKRWLREFKANHKSDFWMFWNRYKKYLAEQKGFADIVIQKNDALTDDILDHLFNPLCNGVIIAKKGLVVGQVQSGKTANYTGLICKAADAGFKVIIILAGIHNNLRSQTQIRIDEGFLGFDTGSDKNYETRLTSKVGVGKIVGFDEAIAHSYTTSLEKGDFTSKAANATGLNFDAPQPIILVVKKNTTVLKRLHTWLKQKNNGSPISHKALLMIDDEADNASINTKRDPKETPTAINNGIREILKLFHRSAYVGYTATPFANIFIPSKNESDLFPRDFIINIPAPSNYIGPDKVFGITSFPMTDDDNLLPIVTPINDYKSFVPERHRKDDSKPTFEDVPNSLKLAIKCFIITCAIRIVRGQEHKHNSMLIHVSRYQIWQNEIKRLVERQFYFYKQEIEAGDPTIIEEFRQVFEEDYVNESGFVYNSYKTISTKILNSKLSQIDNKIQIHDWSVVKNNLFKAVQKIMVKSINGSSGDIIDYQLNENNGLSVIAIGGDKLSRGLTLEGLSVSYFLRASKMYDTLMQMGRWFGYRPGYVDLCRLFTSGELNEWFRHITLASEELRDEFNYLYETGGTPNDYSLKVRTHPGVLQITAINKMYNSQDVQVSWAGRLIETYQLSRDKNIKKSNLIATDNFISSLGNAEKKGNSNKGYDYLWRNVSPDSICNYFNNFRLPTELKKVNLDLICKYIQKLSTKGELTSWRVALLSKNDSDTTYTFSNGLTVGCWTRNRANDISDVNTYFIRKNHIVGNQKEEFIDLDEEMLLNALRATVKEKNNSNETWKHEYPSPKVVREQFRSKTNPLLLIYPLNPEGANVTDNNGNIISGTEVYSKQDDPFIGFAISFPSTDTNEAISYRVNTIGDFSFTEDDFDNNNDVDYDNE